jgi:hypothetical protein
MHAAPARRLERGLERGLEREMTFGREAAA